MEEKKSILSRNKVQRIITAALLVASVALIAVGIYSGEPLEVLSKAVTVCLECIGVG